MEVSKIVNTSLLQSFSTLPAAKLREQDTKPRYTFNARVLYITPSMNTFQECILHDINQGGILISVERSISPNSFIGLVVPDECYTDNTIQIFATVIQQLNFPSYADSNRFNYQCMIDAIDTPL